MKEALLGWFIAAGAAAASFYLLGLAHRMSLSAAQAILSADFGEQVSGPSLALAFFNTAAVAALASLVPVAPIALLYIGFFVLFLASSIILGLALALSAYTALVYMLSAIAPLIIVIGVLRPMRWLHALWLKTVTVILLLPIADALLLKAAVSLVGSFYDPNGSGASLGSFLAGLFVTGGVLSVLIAINFKVGEMMFGALGEIHRQAWGATTGVIQLAATAIGLVAGGIGIAAGATTAVAGGSGPASGAGIASMLPASALSAAEDASANTRVTSASVSPSEATSGGQVASTLGARHGLARRTADLLASRLFGEPRLTRQSDQPHQSSASGVTEQGSGMRAPEGESNSEAATTATTKEVVAGQSSFNANTETSETPISGNIDSSPSPASNRTTSEGSVVHPQDMLRRSQLAEGLGRALAMTGNPALQSLGVGLHTAGMVGEFVAGRTQDEARASPQVARDSQQDGQVLDSALRWSGRNLSTAPNDLFDIGRDNTPLMTGALHQALLTDPDAGRATSMRDVLAVVRASYGQWQTQGQPGGVAAQRAYFEAIADPGNMTSPGRLTGAIVQWAEQYQVHLGARWPDTVQTVFDQSQPMSDSSPDIQMRKR